MQGTIHVVQPAFPLNSRHDNEREITVEKTHPTYTSYIDHQISRPIISRILHLPRDVAGDYGPKIFQKHHQVT